MAEISPDQGRVETGTASGAARSRGGAQARDSGWADLIARAGAGEHQALASLYDESSPLIYSIALRMIRDAADAEEVVLDVYTYVWRFARNYDVRRGSASSWLVMLTRSRAIDRLRSQSAQKCAEEPIAEMLQNLAAPEPSRAFFPFDERQQMVERALSALPVEQRRLIELAFFSGFTQSELAARLELPLGTVKTRMRLAMTKLRDFLKESGA